MMVVSGEQLQYFERTASRNKETRGIPVRAGCLASFLNMRVILNICPLSHSDADV